MAYLNKDDYKYMIRTYRLDQILEAEDEDEDAILDGAEEDALGMIAKHLGNKYDMPLEFGKTGAARNKVVVRWAKVLVIYYIYERVPDEMVPERVVKNYDEVMKALEKIEDGEAGIPSLPPITEEQDGESRPVTRRRWGSLEKRTHDGGSPADLCR